MEYVSRRCFAKRAAIHYYKPAGAGISPPPVVVSSFLLDNNSLPAHHTLNRFWLKNIFIMEEYEFLNDNAEQGSANVAFSADETAPVSTSSISRETVLEFNAIARIAAHRLSQFKDKNGKEQFQDAYRVSADTAAKLTAVGVKVVNGVVYTKAAKDPCLNLKVLRGTREDGSSFLQITTNRSDEERQKIATAQVEERLAKQQEEAKITKIEQTIARLVKLGVSPDKAAEMAMNL